MSQGSRQKAEGSEAARRRETVRLLGRRRVRERVDGAKAIKIHEKARNRAGLDE
jgi:hypothetical protein